MDRFAVTIVGTGAGRGGPGGEWRDAGLVGIAAGGARAPPPVAGLDQVPVWTNREATNVRDIPSRVLLVGGSAVGVEMGQFYAGMGAQVTIVQRAARLVDREDPRVGQLAAKALAALGLTLPTRVTPVSARPPPARPPVPPPHSTPSPTPSPTPRARPTPHTP